MSSFAASRFLTIAQSVGEMATTSVGASDLSDVSSPSDESLLSKICAGDREALGTIFRRYARIALAVGRRILRDDAEADDLVQDVFLYIHRKCRVYNSAKGPASSWIVQTIYYQALQRRMQLTARNQYSSLTIESCEQDAGVSSKVMEYDRSLEGMIGRTRLREMLDSLTEDQWETLRLHFFEGHTLSEIARARGQSVGNVRHHFYRGIEKLRSRIFYSELQDRITSDTR
jgi:RNA polymerase sigma-70 factor, ECF subfamily